MIDTTVLENNSIKYDEDATDDATEDDDVTFNNDDAAFSSSVRRSRYFISPSALNLSSLIDDITSKSVPMVLTRFNISSVGTYLVSSSSFRIFDGDNVDADEDSNANNNKLGIIFGDASDDDNDNSSLLEMICLSSSSNSRYDDDDNTLYIRRSSFTLFSQSSTSFLFILNGSLNELDPSFGNGGDDDDNNDEILLSLDDNESFVDGNFAINDFNFFDDSSLETV